jgi:hypothetical protein
MTGTLSKFNSFEKTMFERFLAKPASVPARSVPTPVTTLVNVRITYRKPFRLQTSSYRLVRHRRMFLAGTPVRSAQAPALPDVAPILFGAGSGFGPLALPLAGPACGLVLPILLSVFLAGNPPNGSFSPLTINSPSSSLRR